MFSRLLIIIGNQLQHNNGPFFRKGKLRCLFLNLPKPPRDTVAAWKCPASLTLRPDSNAAGSQDLYNRVYKSTFKVRQLVRKTYDLLNYIPIST